jgi:hypothetical protein
MMYDDDVHVEWGPFLSACYISLMAGEKFGPTLHISGDGSDTAARMLSALVKHDKARVPLEDVQKALPQRDEIRWSDDLKGDGFFGYEIRGIGDGFRAWVQADGKKGLDQEQHQQLLNKLTSARDVFFPV